ncbi:MAG: ABC transporter permease subunit [Clostridium sp.]|uniref:ABC transporter permease subunit n=1 Tax=Clostridium sp. TaxID=1506 RepID=UPI002FC6DAA5
MNMTLFKREIKSNYKMLLIFLAIVTMYSTMIVAMFDPKLGESLDMMAQSMPQLFSAFGMAKPATTLIGFISSYLYGFILIVIPLIFIIILCNKLIARYVDKGSMAYLIATPNKRRNIVVTQAAVSMISIFCIVLYAALICITTGEIMFPGEMDILKFILINIGLYGLLFFFGGVCFLSSCVFNDSRLSSGVGGGICVFFVLLQMISQVGDKFEFLKYITPLTLFQPDKLALGEGSAIGMVSILYGTGLALYIIGIGVFTKKDLSL